MTEPQRPFIGDRLAAQDQGGTVNLHGAALIARRDAPSGSAAADLSNVVPFARPRRTPGHEAPDVAVSASDRPPAATPDAPLALRIAMAAGSLAIHGLILVGFWQAPKPLASIGIEAITVEVVLGGHTAAGLATTASENEVQAATPAPEEKPEEQAAEQAQLATAMPQQVAIAERDTAPEARPDERPVEAAVAELAPQAQPPERQPQAIETPPVETPDALPPVAQAETADAVVMPEPERQKPTPPEAQKPKATQPVQKAAQPKRVAAPTAKKSSQQKRASAAASNAASGVGRGRSDLMANYPGRVAAHLARHKQYPSDARSAGSQGVATVSFSLDGSGRVTSVRLARGSGVASIDREVQSMVRRASPFPAPPDGRGRSFTVPVRFNLR